jgi:hypothetical protein
MAFKREVRAAEQHDELAPFQLVEEHSVPVTGPTRIGEEQSAGIQAVKGC